MHQDLLVPENYIEPDDRFTFESSGIVINENITPQMYLKYAIQDFEGQQGDRSNVNAFANAKELFIFKLT